MLLLMVQKSGQPVEVGSLSHYLQGFIHPRWCRISSINSSSVLKILLDVDTSLKTNATDMAGQVFRVQVHFKGSFQRMVCHFEI